LTAARHFDNATFHIHKIIDDLFDWQEFQTMFLRQDDVGWQEIQVDWDEGKHRLRTMFQ